MINNITLENFKAFAGKVEFVLEDVEKDIHGKHLLAYGENGSGKSSLFEALRLFFYQDGLLQEHLKLEGKAGEVAEADITNFLRGYNNRKTGVDFTLKVNNQTRADFPFAAHACYMLGHQDVQLADEPLKVINFLQDRTLPAFDVNGFWEAKKEVLIENVNKAILNDFKEPFTVEIADAYSTLRIVDATRGVSPENHYRKLLNEAKLHLVALLLFLEAVKLHKATLAADVDKVLVLDDIVTSLDVTNRIFLVNYLIREFADCQLMLLTHNVSFFNLVHFKVGEAVDNDESRWALVNICEIGGDSKVIVYNDTVSSGKIKDEYQADHDGEAAGNKIRRRFEAVMYEYAKLIQIDQFEEANHILARLINKNLPVFVRKKSKNEMYWTNELLDEIIAILDGGKTESEKVTDIRNQIGLYKQHTEVQKVVELLKEMKMFQKVVLHQLSHGTGARPTFTNKEIEYSLVLLKKFELLVKAFKDSNAYVM